jgi:cytochrome c553
MRFIIFLATFFCYQNLYANLPEKLTICASCHGMDGIAKQNDYPNLAGQSANYLFKQLLDYKSQTRSSAIMQAFVMTLSEKEMLELSKYYSKLPQISSSKISKPTKYGEILYKIGNRSKGIAACIACHGPNGHGNDPAKYPNISHQQPSYLKIQLLAFKHKKRSNDPKAMMRNLSEHLSELDIDELINYLQKLA